MTPAPLIELDAVALCYRLAKQRIPSLKEYAIHWMKGALTYEELWAIRDLSLTIGRGETVGIIGRNGAGKSTLLKIVSGVLAPTRGRVTVTGRIAPVLAIGTGFDFELTGVENIYLNALLLGRSRAEIDAKAEEIVEFSGLGDFIRSPIRNYSTGMLARLGFAVATAWIPDVLILDEVLGVGDIRFRHLCAERLDSFRRHGTTILMVSHDLTAVETYCERCLWIDQGRLRADGPSARVVPSYRDLAVGPALNEPLPDGAAPDGRTAP